MVWVVESFAPKGSVTTTRIDRAPVAPVGLNKIVSLFNEPTAVKLPPVPPTTNQLYVYGVHAPVVLVDNLNWSPKQAIEGPAIEEVARGGTAFVMVSLRESIQTPLVILMVYIVDAAGKA